METSTNYVLVTSHHIAGEGKQNGNVNDPSAYQSVAQQSTRHESDMKYEFNRLRTFEAVWPIYDILPEELARYGFYYTGSHDIVKCHFCYNEIGAWEEIDDVITKHQRWSPCCPLMRKQRTANVPLDPNFLDNIQGPEPNVISNHGGGLIHNVPSVNSHHISGEGKQNGNAKDPSPYQSVAQLSTRHETDMNYECDRLTTFEAVWLIYHILPEVLARYGFYYVGSPDHVKCHFCGILIFAWEEGDDVITEHLRWSPHCPLMRKKWTDNVPLDPHFLESVPDPSPDVSSYYGGPRHSDSVPICRPEHPQYALESERLKSLEDWPSALAQKPEQLSDAGFFYTGKGDSVQCYYCGGGLKHWERDDDPWEQHAIWYSNCKYLQQMKDRSFIEMCLAKKEGRSKAKEEVPCASKSSASVASPREEETEGTEEILCKICYENEFGTALIPCGHVTCSKCALHFGKCPMCLSPIQNMQKLYLM